MIKAFIVEDEQLARDDFKRILTTFDSVEIIGEAESLEEAKNKCRDLVPDIVFLDIQLTNESGFGLLDYLDEKTKVVFVTAYDEYAIKAFEVNAFDYLLKPVTKERLNQTIEKITSDSGDDSENKNGLLSVDDNLFLKLDSGYQFVKVAKIKYITSADDYSEVFVDDQKKGKLTNKTLNEWECRLPSSTFCRIHRYSIINIEYIEKIEPWYNYSYKVYVKGEIKPLLMSRRYFAHIKKQLG